MAQKILFPRAIPAIAVEKISVGGRDIKPFDSVEIVGAAVDGEEIVLKGAGRFQTHPRKTVFINDPKSAAQFRRSINGAAGLNF